MYLVMVLMILVMGIGVVGGNSGSCASSNVTSNANTGTAAAGLIVVVDYNTMAETGISGVIGNMTMNHGIIGMPLGHVNALGIANGTSACNMCNHMTLYNMTMSLVGGMIVGMSCGTPTLLPSNVLMGMSM